MTIKKTFNVSILKILIALLFSMLCQAAMAEPQVGFEQSLVKAQKGELLSLQLSLSDFPVTQGGGVSLKFNPRKMRVVSVEVDQQWSFASRPGKIDNQKGVVSDILFSQLTGVSGNIPVAWVEVEIVAKGRSKVILSESNLNPFAGEGKPINVSFNNLRVAVKKH